MLRRLRYTPVLFNKNPEFYAFVRSLHAYKTALPISQISDARRQ